jgi:uncharacterized protein (TIGR03435 family)
MRLLPFLLLPAALAQQFDVASVKPAEPRGPEEVVVHPGNVAMHNVRLRAIVKWAYDVKEYQVTAPGWMGSPGWLGREIARFEVAAKAPEGTPAAQLRVMMQRLLTERFHMEVHRETRETPVFVLTAPKVKGALHPAPDAEGPGRWSGNGGDLVAKGVSMAEFAELMAGPLHTPVLDRTNLAGRFDFSVSAKIAQPDDSMSAIFTTLEDQLGLKVQREMAPIEMLIVDHADQKPTEN